MVKSCSTPLSYINIIFKSQIIYLLEEVRVVMSGLELVGSRLVSVSLFMMTLKSSVVSHGSGAWLVKPFFESLYFSM